MNPDLVARDEKGQAYTVRYEAVNAMLLNEFLKEHQKVEQQGRQLIAQARKMEEQQVTIAELRSTIAQHNKGMEALAAQVKEQNAKIDRVNAKLELTKLSPRTADNR